MKKIILLALLVSIAGSAFSWNFETAKVFTKKGEMLELKVKTYESGCIISGSKIKYDLNGKVKKIAISSIDSILIDSKKYEVFSYQKEIKTGPNRGIKTFTILGEVLLSSKPVSVYKSYFVQNEGFYNGTVYVVTGHHLAWSKYLVSSRKTTKLGKLGFKSMVKGQYKNCSKADEILEGKTYQKSDLVEVIEELNTSCH